VTRTAFRPDFLIVPVRAGTFNKMKNAGTYYIIVVEDLTVPRIVASGSLILENKFIHSCGRVMYFFIYMCVCTIVYIYCFLCIQFNYSAAELKILSSIPITGESVLVKCEYILG